MNDEYDLAEAKKIVIREWIQTSAEVEKFLGIIQETKKIPKLSLNPEDFP